ncbi:hypothetical protein AYK25_04575 [Thermoplasmatales archaeon SM1-50]|nr:MAG: hypothetical protein AYK25_04575 [Thermoplasmatales archaeon SM1-50]
MKQKFKLVLFDMDGTLLNDRTIFVFAKRKGFIEQLSRILDSTIEPYEKTLKIASLLKGMRYRELLDIFRNIPLQEHVNKVIPTLRENQIKIALATDGYQCFANDLKKRLGLNYAFANRLMINNQLVTGELLFQNKELQQSSNAKIYSINKRSVLEFLCMILDISPDEVIAVGDGFIDTDMIKAAGLGIAYRAPQAVQTYADVVTDDLRIILKYIER